MSVTRGFLLSLLLCLLGAAVAQAQPVGTEFRVNTYTTSIQLFPQVASDASGNFVVVWTSHYQDGSGWGIFGQRYDSGGQSLGGEVQINTYTTGDQREPSVASDASGNVVVVWASYDQDGSYDGVFGQRYDNGGNRIGGEFQVNTYTTYSQRVPSVSADAAGNFIVVWGGRPDQYELENVFGQRYDSNGNPLGGEFQVTTYTTNLQWLPSVAADANGDFVVVWRSYFQDGSGYGIFGQRYDSDGNRLGAEFQVNTYTTNGQDFPAVASNASGNFVVVWRSGGQDGDTFGIFGQRYDSEGNPLGGEFQVNKVNTYTTSYDPSVASDSSGNFVVVWKSYGHERDASGIFGQRYDRNGVPLGREFHVNTYTTGQQAVPAVASDASGNFVVVWSSFPQEGNWGVFGQRFSGACEASLQVQGDVHTPGSTLPIRIHIAHNRPETVTVPWELSLIAASGWVVAERVTPPHTFEPGDVVDVELALPLPEHLEEGTYTLRLGIGGMAGIEAATTTFRVVRAE
jgi:hypothetical protein